MDRLGSNSSVHERATLNDTNSSLTSGCGLNGSNIDNDGDSDEEVVESSVKSCLAPLMGKEWLPHPTLYKKFDLNKDYLGRLEQLQREMKVCIKSFS